MSSFSGKGSYHAVEQRDGTKYQAMIDIPVDDGRKRKTKLCDTEDEAVRWLMKMNLRLGEDVDVEPSAMPLAGFLRDWLKDKKSEVADSTIKKYEWTLEGHVIPELGELPIKELTAYHLDEFYKDKQEKLSSSTVKTIHGALQTALNEAVRQQLVETNPAENAKCPKVKKTKIDTLTESEAAKLNNAMSDENSYEMAIYLALNTGMRRSEVLGLTWDNVDFQNGLIAVQRTLVRNMQGGYNFGEPKSESSYRNIAMTDATAEKLKAYQQKVFRYKMEADEWENDELVFVTKNGTHLQPRNVRRKLNKKIDELEISDCTFHELRHTHATLMLKEDVNPKKVQERLGHSSIEVTLDKYSHVTPQMQREAAEKISNLIE